MHLFLAAIWFALAGYVLLGPGVGRFGHAGGWFALVFGLYNVARWYARRRPPAPLPRRHPRRADEPYEGPNPDFDFDLRRPEMESKQ